MSAETAARPDLRHDVGLALIREWDPIGVGQFPEAADEYQAYVQDVCDLLSSGRSLSDLFDYLWQLETEHMGLSGDREATIRFATRLRQIGIAAELRDVSASP